MTNPLSSSFTRPESHSVLGAAPTMMNRARVATSRDCPLLALRMVMCSRCSPPLKCRDLAVVLDRDAGISLQSAGEIARHRGGERGAPDQHTNAAGIAAQEHRSLAGGIAATNDHRLGVLAITSLHLGG